MSFPPTRDAGSGMFLTVPQINGLWLRSGPLTMVNPTFDRGPTDESRSADRERLDLSGGQQLP